MRVVLAAYPDGAPLGAIADELGLTSERARQVERDALAVMRARIAA